MLSNSPSKRVRIYSHRNLQNGNAIIYYLSGKLIINFFLVSSTNNGEDASVAATRAFFQVLLQINFDFNSKVIEPEL